MPGPTGPSRSPSTVLTWAASAPVADEALAELHHAGSGSGSLRP